MPKISALPPMTTPIEQDDEVPFVDDSVGTTKKLTRGMVMPSGAILQYGGATAPSGFLLCDGSAVSRTTYANLFAVLGTSFGVGDGSTTFNLPDLRQRFPLGKADSGTGSTLGETGGEIDHVHPLGDAGGAAVDGTGNDIRVRRVEVGDWTATIANNNAGTYTSSSGSRSRATALVGNTDAANPPFVSLNYIVSI